MTKVERQFLEAVRDGADVFPMVKSIGFGWAIQRGLIHHAGPLGSLDFKLTAAGLAALNATDTGDGR